jgi:YbbR domain-containing protein
LNFFARNLGALLLAFTLAVVVWVSAVITADPNEEHTLRPVSIEISGQDPNMVLVGEIPNQVRMTLQAPRSIWEQLNNNPGLARAWIDLSGLGAGEHTVEVKTHVDASPVRYNEIDPQEINLKLESLVKRSFPVELVLSGDLPLGYRRGTPTVEPGEVVISGPESAVNEVAQVRANLDISGAFETVQRNISLEAVDERGEAVTNLTIMPKEINVVQPVSLLGGFKNVVVKVVTTGQVANGYRLTNISVSPPTVTLFSDNPQLLNEVPGFVETEPLDLTNLDDDIELNVVLALPEGITSVREPSVFVQVAVAAIEGSLTINVPVEVTGLAPELEAVIAPETVDVIVAGPLNMLERLSSSSFRVILDLSGLPPGVYQREPVVDLYPEEVRVQTTLPETVGVTIVLAPTPTISASASPAPTGSPAPTSTPTTRP